MTLPTARDVWFYRNQPHGYWKAGNPFVKFSCLVVILVGSFAKQPALMVQGTVLCLFLLYMPTRPNSKIQNISINFGVGAMIVSVLDQRVFWRILPPIQTKIPYVATIDWVLVGTYALVVVAFLSIGKAITSRDLAWLIDVIPRWGKETLGAQIYAYTYGMFRGPEVFRNLGDAIRSRGGCSLCGKKACKKTRTFVDILGIWCLNLLRHIDDMAVTVDYVLQSRIRLIDRTNPSKRAWSSTDYSIAGIIIFVIVMPRIIRLVI